jgi:hypothetical protein
MVGGKHCSLSLCGLRQD